MKFNFHVSPNIRGKLTTSGIMRDLTIGLLIVYACSCIYYAVSYGANYALQAILLLACSLITTFVCEAIFAYFSKKDIKKFISTSFGWVTAIILTMMCPITVTPYALIIATIFAVAVARLMFGGFGQNVFNPAAVGRAVIFAAFSGAATDLVTSATPTTTLASTYHWLPATPEVLDEFLETCNGWLGLLIGNYPGAIGETFSIVILAVGVFLVIRHVIDWRIPVVYLGTIAVLAAVIALLAGLESYHGIPAFLWYPALHLLTGGVIFGAVFMLTDPVTSPTCASARVFFACCAGVLTVLIRLKANLPEGCLYSILIMNTFTPLIESSLDGKQLEQKKKSIIMLVCALICGLGVSFYAASSTEKVTTISAATSSSSATSSASEEEDETSAATEESEEDETSAATEEEETTGFVYELVETGVQA
jgi:electron transport complex protein RnfD